MEANELRIGNWVNYKGYGQVNFHSLDVLFIKHAKDFEPIPLTPEILKKCGFKKEGLWAIINFPPRMGIRFYDFNYAECDIIQDDKFIAFKNSQIKYLHQLQNLYFALTGKELTVNLSEPASLGA